MSLWGTSPVVQWLKFCAPNARGPGSIPGQGTRSHTAKKKKNYLTFLLGKFLLSICILSLSHNKVSCFVMSITWPLPAFSSVQFSRSVVSDSVRPHGWQPTRLPRPWDSPGKNTGVGCHFLLQCMKVKSEREVAQSCLTLSDPMDCSLPGSSVHGFSRQEYWSGVPLPSLS